MFRASLRPSSGEKTTCYCIWGFFFLLVVLDVAGCGSVVLRCRVWALWRLLLELQPSQCSHPTTQHHKTATSHIQHYQQTTPYAVIRGLFSPDDGHKGCPKHVETVVNNKHLKLTINIGIVASRWYSLFTICRMFGTKIAWKLIIIVISAVSCAPERKPRWVRSSYEVLTAWLPCCTLMYYGIAKT